MNLLDLNLLHTTVSATAAPALTTPSPSPTARAARPVDTEFWSSMVQQVSLETGDMLTSALDRVRTMVNTGSIDSDSLAALRDEIEQARHAGRVSRQIARLVAEDVPKLEQRLPLADLLREQVESRKPGLQERGLRIKSVLHAIDVMADATLLRNLLSALLDWSARNASEAISLRIEVLAAPSRARLFCRYAPQAARSGADLTAAALNHVESPATDLTWLLIQQLARTMSVPVEQQFTAQRISVGFEFDCPGDDGSFGVSVTEFDDGFQSTQGGGLQVAGSQVLVMASRRDVRAQIREALRGMGLVVDFAASLEEAGQFCSSGAPHALIFESHFRGVRLDDVIRRVHAHSPEAALIEVVEDTLEDDGSSLTSERFGRISRDGIRHSLPLALAIKLSSAE